jgi:Flp pilus assembly protein TadG
MKRIEAEATDTRRAPGCRRLDATSGAVFVEFLIAFLPVYVFFLCLVQLTILFAVRLVAEHAATCAARAAAVVIGDDGRYGSEKLHELNTSSGRRFEAIRNAALIALSPMILNGAVQHAQVVFPPENTPGGAKQTGVLRVTPMRDGEISKVRVRVEVQAACRIGLANVIACARELPGQRRGQRTKWWQALGLLTPTAPVQAEAVFPYQGARYEYR